MRKINFIKKFIVLFPLNEALICMGAFFIFLNLIFSSTSSYAEKLIELNNKFQFILSIQVVNNPKLIDSNKWLKNINNCYFKLKNTYAYMQKSSRELDNVIKDTTVRNIDQKIEEHLKIQEEIKNANTKRVKIEKVEDNKKNLVDKKVENNASPYELINLNPSINKWFILKNSKLQNLHIENVSAKNSLKLYDNGIQIMSMNNKEFKCSLWNNKNIDLRKVDFKSHKNPYFSICDGLLYVRLNKKSSTKLSLTEWATEKLRKVKFGESLINLVKPLIVARQAEASNNRVIAFFNRNNPFASNGLLEAKLVPKSGSQLVSVKNHLGVSVQNTEPYIRYGKWYQSKMHPEIHVGLMIPKVIDPKILKTHSDKVSPIHEKELDKLIYLSAYDLSKYSVNFVHGTTYPGLPEGTKTNNYSLIGSVPPYMVDRTVGVFIGGYKRSHGYFKYGEHQGKYYGYIENGVVLSKMEPDLATIYSTKSGEVNMIKWPNDKAKEKKLLKKIVSARQNGVMIIDNYKPGKHVKSWGGGNWSGDVKGNLRTLRSSVCMQEKSGKKYLIFAAFTAATPSTMARVLQAYSCKSAMQLDMNAYMYLHNAIFRFDKKHNIDIEYLHTEMEYPKGLTHHRYIMDNNNRDFFYIFKK